MELHLVNLRPNIKISNKTTYTKNMVISFIYLVGETSSYKVVRCVRFARPVELLSRNTGLSPDN
jgi:hypothetical protein